MQYIHLIWLENVHPMQIQHHQPNGINAMHCMTLEMVSLYSFNFNRIISVEKCEEIIARNASVMHTTMVDCHLCTLRANAKANQNLRLRKRKMKKTKMYPNVLNELRTKTTLLLQH